MTGPNAVALAAQLSHARDHVPYYQRFIHAAEITEDNAYDLLRSLPPLSREEVHANRVRLWSMIGDALTWRTVRTTGITGAPVEVVVDHMAQQAEHETLRRHIEEFVPSGSRPGHAVFHLTLHASARTRTSLSPGPLRTRLVKWNLSRAWQLPDERLRQCLETLNGHIITAMPSVVSALVERVREGGLISPALVILSGETVTDRVRDRVVGVFDCPTTSMYTLAEMGIAGVGCKTTNGYHVNDNDVVIELLEDGSAAPPDSAGLVTITSLTNRAMPLIRYETGDRARWDDTLCGCPLTGRLFRLSTTRAVRVLARAGAGRRVTSLDVAKLFAQLDVRSVDLVQDETGAVTVEYQGGAQLPDTTASTIAAAIRGMLGPSTVVRVHRRLHHRAGTGFSGSRDQDVALAPTGRDPAELAEWARARLLGLGIEAAVITGSILSPETFTRFSDIDLTVVVDKEDDPRWRTVAKAMHQHVAGLRVNVTTATSLADAPLVRARLLSERHPVLGSLEQARICWPTPEDLAGEARFWAQDAKAVLWTQATAPSGGPLGDPIRTAWLAARFSLDALRYCYLCRGARTTVPTDTLNMAQAENAPDLPGILIALDVATERRPPQPSTSGEAEHMLTTALSTVEWMRSGLPTRSPMDTPG